MGNRISLLVLFLFILMALACTPHEPKKEKDHVTLQLKWLHQGQFAGFYLAKEKGYYAAENLNVTLLEGGNEINPYERLSAGEADFAVVSAESIFTTYQENRNVKAVAVIFQRSPVVFVSRTASRIIRPQDFAGKTVAVNDVERGGFVEAQIQFNALMRKMGLQSYDYKKVPYDPLYKDFLADKVDVTPAYFVNGVVRLRNMGIKLHLIWPGDYGIHFYSDTLVTTNQYLQEKPDIAMRFFRASMKGWKDVVENTDEAVEMTLKYTDDKDGLLQRDIIEALFPLIHSGENPIGWMEPEIWRSMHQRLVELEILKTPIQNIEDVYSLDLLHALFGAVQVKHEAQD